MSKKEQVLFGGRTVVVLVKINTDESPEECAKRVAHAAAGPKVRMQLTSVAVDQNMTDMWERVIKGLPS